MKSIKLILSIAISIYICDDISAQSVYITDSGEKYHNSFCRFLKHSKKETTLSKAKSVGYTACKICKPMLYNDKDSKKIVPLKTKKSTHFKR